MSSAAQSLNQSVEALVAMFKGFPLLESFPDHLIMELVQAAEIFDLPPHTQILQQGQLNEHLYFLISGMVGIYVDGGRVSKLQRKGDLLGEMSVISKKPVGATILSESQVTLLRVNSRFFLDMKGPEKDLYLSILYRIYALVLADKLHETNQKAKHFEEMSVQLKATQSELEEANATLERKVEERTQRLEQQNAELMASKNKTELLLNSKRILFHKLNDFQQRNLKPLKAHLDEMRRRAPDERVVNDARAVLFEVQQVLGPLTDQYSSEQAAQGKRVLLADTNKKQQIIAKMALGGTGVVLDIASTLEDGRARLEASSYDLVMFDANMVELGNLAAAKNPRTALVLMTSDQIPQYLPALKQLQCTPHIVSRDEADRTFTVKNIMTTVSKLLSEDLFGLDKYLSWGVDVQALQITGSRSRPELIATVDTQLEKLGVRRANRDRIKTVTEELLMNAIYDAPTDKDGKALYNHMPRTTPLSLKAEEQGLLRFATDGMVIAVSVQDPFGSLKSGTLLRYLENSYSAQQEDINARENKGGAGRGLYQIVENSDLVVFNVVPGQKTEVIALFNVEVKEKSAQTPSFHLFIKG